MGKAFVAAVKAASENKKTIEAQGVQPKALAKRSPTKVSELTEAQKNLALAIRDGKATIAKQRALQKETPADKLSPEDRFKVGILCAWLKL